MPLRSHEQRRRAVVDPRRVAGGDRAASRNGVGSFASLSSVVSARGCSSRDHDGLAPALRDRDRRDLPGQPPARLRRRGALLRAQREGVLIRARHLELRGDVLAGLRHRIDAVLRLDQRVDEAPADRGVVDLGMARERRLGLGHDERRPRHALDAARDHQMRLARLDRSRRDQQGVHAGAAQPVDRAAGMACGSPRATGPCARRCGCPRRPDWRSRAPRRPRPPSRGPGGGPSTPSAAPRRDRRCARRRARRRSGRSACGRSRRRRLRPSRRFRARAACACRSRSTARPRRSAARRRRRRRSGSATPWPRRSARASPRGGCW